MAATGNKSALVSEAASFFRALSYPVEGEWARETPYNQIPVHCFRRLQSIQNRSHNNSGSHCIRADTQVHQRFRWLIEKLGGVS